jgi:DNA repair exonuclease SbcCD ATPase subunit
MLLDEITGKLSQTSIEEFAEILDLIKANVKRVLIVEHNANFNPDHVINVWLDENDLSNLSFA